MIGTLTSYLPDKNYGFINGKMEKIIFSMIHIQIILKRKKYMTTTIVSGIFLFLPVLLGILGVAIFSAKKNVESKNN